MDADRLPPELVKQLLLAQVVSKFYPNANLDEPPPPCAGNGRPRVKGRELPAPQGVVAPAARTRLHMAWSGGGRRDVEVVTGTGHCYKAGEGLVPVRRVYVHDLTGTHRGEYFDSTDVPMTAQEIIEAYAVPTWAWRARACGVRGRCVASRRARWGCTASSHRFTGCCRRRSGSKGRWRGRARPP